MREIALTQGRVSLVDDEDFEAQSVFPWCVSVIGKHPYAKRRCNVRKTIVYLHREIMCPPTGFVVDHINGDTLDNRRENLRIASKQGNAANRGLDAHNKSGFKGVFWHKQTSKWAASATVNGRRIYFGFFDDPVSAAKAHNEGAVKHFGEFAWLNPIPEAS